MGSHMWVAHCPYCTFEEMIVSTYDAISFEIICPICGYAKWTEESVPDNHDIEIVKRRLAEMDSTEKQNAVELYYEDNIPLITRLKRK